jgi:uncharacterized protein
MNFDFLLPILVAFGASLLTFFSGFGLGTSLMPVFAIYFPLDQAIALTAIVHLLNNLFKLQMTWKNIDRSAFIKFGIPAIIAAFLGAFLLKYLGEMPVLSTKTQISDKF